MEEIDETIEMEENEDMEVQPASLTVKEKQEVRDLVACLLKQRLGKLGNLVTRYLDGHGSMRNYMPVLHTAAESMSCCCGHWFPQRLDSSWTSFREDGFLGNGPQ